MSKFKVAQKPSSRAVKHSKLKRYTVFKPILSYSVS